MKIIFKFRVFVLFTSALLFVILFSKCNKKDNEKKCCEGYTGKITNPLAGKLVNTCHFIEQDSIAAWTARYQENKKPGLPDTLKGPKALQGLPGINYLPGDSSSFNSCIIKKIICDENCIGLRVVYGMSADKKIHVILVGINPDYSTLYIKEPEECCTSNTQQLQNAASSTVTGKIGGAEYGQIP
jgi:hypothetical protein